MAQGFFNSGDDLDRRRALAEAMYQRASEENAGGGRMVSGHLVNTPIMALANALKTGLGGYAVGAINRESDEKKQKYSQDLASLLAPQMASGSQQMDENGAVIPQPPSDIMSRVMASGNPDLILQFAPSLLSRNMERQDKAEDRAIDRKDKAVTPLSPEEIAARGYRPGTVAVRDAFGNERVIQESDVMSDPALNQKLRVAAAGRSSMGGGGSGGNVQSIQQLTDGSLLKVYRDGSTERVTLDGAPVTGAQYDPENRFRVNAATAGGKAAGAVAEDLPRIEATFNEITRSLDAFNKPDVKSQASRSLGLIDSRLPNIPGYNANFANRLEQIKGQTFLQAFNALRGGGQITEAEGSKATASLARLDRAQTEKDFYEALSDAKRTFGELYSAAKSRASRGAVVPQLRGGEPASAPQGVRRYNPATGKLE